MPFYEYQCHECGAITELERKIKDRKKQVSCSKCRSPNVEQIISRCDFALMGGGWGCASYSKKKKKR